MHPSTSTPHQHPSTSTKHQHLFVHATPYFAPAFVYGGPPRTVLGLCHGLQEAGAEVAVVTTTANGRSELGDEVTSRSSFEGVPVEYVPRSRPKRHFAAAGLDVRLDRVRRRCGLVHIHGCWNFFGWSVARWCWREGIPYVVSPRGMLHPWSFAHQRIAKTIAYGLMESRVLRGARFIHVTSAEEAEIVRRLDVNANIVMVPNGVDVSAPPAESAVQEYRARIGAGPGDFVVLYVGRLHPKKGLETLVDAFRPIAARHPRARLLIAGSGDEHYVRRLRESCRGLEAAGHVSFPGFLDGDERRLAFAAASAFAFTSHSENFGMSVAEAMAAGCPVIVGRGSPWPQIETWRAGFWVEHSCAAVTDALETLASDPLKGRVMGQNGQRGVRQHLNWNQLAGRLLEAYGTAIEAKARPKAREAEVETWRHVG
jgi:glycosyltransferase involved in cell wall biosynthesis